MIGKGNGISGDFLMRAHGACCRASVTNEDCFGSLAKSVGQFGKYVRAPPGHRIAQMTPIMDAVQWTMH